MKLWTTLCPNCGYSLEGLESVGRCPECGREYDRSKVILHGWPRGNHETLANAKRARLGWVIAGSMGYFGLQTFNALSGSTWHWSFQLVWMLPFFLSCGYLLLKRTNHVPSASIQVRLSPAGCVQYDDLADPDALEEVVTANLWVIPVFVAVCLAITWRFQEIGTVPFVILMVIALLFLRPAWRRSRRFRSATRQVKEGTAGHVNEALREPTPWNEVSSFGLLRLSNGHWRLIVNAKNSFWYIAPKIPVDAEIQCSDEQVKELRELIYAWRATSASG